MAISYPSFTGEEPCATRPGGGREWFDGDNRDDHYYGDNASIELAREHCASCPMLEPCMRYAVSRKEDWGVWGASTPQERRVIRRWAAWPVWNAPMRRWERRWAAETTGDQQ